MINQRRKLIWMQTPLKWRLNRNRRIYQSSLLREETILKNLVLLRANCKISINIAKAVIRKSQKRSRSKKLNRWDSLIRYSGGKRKSPTPAQTITLNGSERAKSTWWILNLKLTRGRSLTHPKLKSWKILNRNSKTPRGVKPNEVSEALMSLKKMLEEESKDKDSRDWTTRTELEEWG